MVGSFSFMTRRSLVFIIHNSQFIIHKRLSSSLTLSLLLCNSTTLQYLHSKMENNQRIVAYCEFKLLYLQPRTCAEPSRMSRRLGWAFFDIRKGVYLALCAWLFGTSQLSIIRQRQGNGRCLRDMYIQYSISTARIPRRLSVSSLAIFYISAWASALLVSTDGQCEGLKQWDEWQVQIPTFFLLNI